METAAFQQIVSAHRAAVFGIIARLTGQSDVVENLAIDVFAAAYRLRSPVANWERCLLGLAADRAIRHLHESRPATDRLAVLTPEERAAFVLQFGENRPEAEVCAILRVSPGTLRSRLTKAHSRLTKAAQPSGAWFIKFALGWKR